MKKPNRPIKKVKLTQKGKSNENFHLVQKYLSRFGYLDLNNCTLGELCNSTNRAIMKYQEFNRLTQTGNFDKETKNLMLESRCAHQDLTNGIRFVTTCAWDKRNLTFAFDTHTSDLADNQGFQAVRDAFQTWEDATSLSFTEVAATDNPDIMVDWRSANDPDLDMTGGTLAHADFPPGCGVVTNTLPKPLHFDDSEHQWVIGAQAGGFDVETVALHEIGHLLGLAHSNAAGAIMNPSVSSNSTKRVLTADDIGGVNELYPPSKLKFSDDKFKFFDDKEKFTDDKLKFFDDKFKFTDDKLKFADDGGGFKKIKDDPKFKFQDDPFNPKGFDFPPFAFGQNNPNMAGQQGFRQPFILSTPHKYEQYKSMNPSQQRHGVYEQSPIANTKKQLEAIEFELKQLEQMLGQMGKHILEMTKEYEGYKAYYEELAKQYEQANK